MYRQSDSLLTCTKDGFTLIEDIQVPEGGGGGGHSELCITILSTLSFIEQFTFTFMHLADAFIQSDLQLHSGYTFSLVYVFPGNRTHNLSLS